MARNIIIIINYGFLFKYTLKYILNKFYLKYIYLCGFSALLHYYSSVSHDPSEIIIICRFISNVGYLCII